MLKRLPEKTVHTAKRARRFEKRERKYDSIPFQGAPVKAGQEIAEKLDQNRRKNSEN